MASRRPKMPPRGPKRHPICAPRGPAPSVKCTLLRKFAFWAFRRPHTAHEDPKTAPRRSKNCLLYTSPSPRDRSLS
eukprot:8246221-Pyramimonas_sp.AAC.1